MKCQRCEKQATFHITEIAKPEVIEVHLCEDCARQYLAAENDAGGDESSTMAVEQTKIGQTAEELARLDHVLPGETVPVTVTANNRNMRALYQAKGEWAVQVMKPAARYTQTWGRPGIAQFYVGGSSAFGGDGRRVYFPPADTGRVISLGEIYYTTAGGSNLKGPVQLTAAAKDVDPVNGLPYIQVSDYFADFQGFDLTYGNSVKSVKGASVAVRVLWNPDQFTLTSDTVDNMSRLDRWMQGWRRSTVETYLQRGY